MFDWIRRLVFRPSQTAREAHQNASQLPSFSQLATRVPFLSILPQQDKQTLPTLVRQFIDEKQFWGAQDVQITHDIKIMVAAQACVLITRLPHLGLYPKTKEVIIYPSEFGNRIEAIGPDGASYLIEPDKIGETWHRGPVLLSLESLLDQSANPRSAHNTVFHEFAHALDYLNGEADGEPPFETEHDQTAWRHILSEAYTHLVFSLKNGRRPFIDPYGANNTAEFFAVATEHFFTRPRQLQRSQSALYAALRRFYRQDPSTW